MVNVYNTGEATVQDIPLTRLVKSMKVEENLTVFKENQEKFLGLLQVNNMAVNQNALLSEATRFPFYQNFFFLENLDYLLEILISGTVGKINI